MLRPNTLHGTAANPVPVLVLAQVTTPATTFDAGAVMGQLNVQHTRSGRKEKCHGGSRKETDSLSVVSLRRLATNSGALRPCARSSISVSAAI
jgi:hypothetical protein